MNITYTVSSYQATTRVYHINIPDTTVKITAAVADNSPINPVALHQTLIGTLRAAQAKGRVWGYTTFLKPDDDPFLSDIRLYPECNITLNSESTSPTSRNRLKYGRVILVLKALHTFLYEGNKWDGTLFVVFDNGVCIGTGSVLPVLDDQEQMPASIIRKWSSLDDTGCSLYNDAQS